MHRSPSTVSFDLDSLMSSQLHCVHKLFCNLMNMHLSLILLIFPPQSPLLISVTGLRLDRTDGGIFSLNPTDGSAKSPVYCQKFKLT